MRCVPNPARLRGACFHFFFPLTSGSTGTSDASAMSRGLPQVPRGYARPIPTVSDFRKCLGGRAALPPYCLAPHSPSLPSPPPVRSRRVGADPSVRRALQQNNSVVSARGRASRGRNRGFTPHQAAILGDVTDLIAIPLGDGTQILATVKTNAQGVHTIGLQCDEGKPGLVVRVWAFSKSRHNL